MVVLLPFSNCKAKILQLYKTENIMNIGVLNTEHTVIDGLDSWKNFVYSTKWFLLSLRNHSCATSHVKFIPKNIFCDSVRVYFVNCRDLVLTEQQIFKTEVIRHSGMT